MGPGVLCYNNRKAFCRTQGVEERGKGGSPLTDQNKKAARLALAWAWVLACAAGVVAVCSRSSFFYPQNNWGDAQCFFTVGKSMVRGQVLYRDIFDHKGPLLYWLHGLASFVQRDGFFGVFLLEVAAAAVFLWFVQKLLKLYGVGWLRWAALPLILGVCFSCASFQMGDSAEELSLPMMAASLYFALRTVRRKETVAFWQAAVQGMVCGLVFWIKFNLCGFWAAFGILLFFYSLCQGGLRAAARLTAGFFAGFALTALPWLLYFGFHGALADLWTVYFYDNLFAYSGGAGMTLASVLQKTGHGLSYMLGLNWTFGVFAVLGLAWFVFWPEKSRSGWERGLAAAAAVLMAVSIYGAASADYIYYGVPFMLFVPLGALGLALAAQRLLPAVKASSRRLAAVGCAAALAVGVGYALWHTPNRQAFLQPLEETVQYQFKQVIDRSEDKSMTMRHVLDGGFYTICDVMPQQKYIGWYNLNLPEIAAQRDAYMNEAQVEFIVARTEEEDWEQYKAENEPAILENYQLVADGTEEYLRNKGYSTMHYYLYQRRS